MERSVGVTMEARVRWEWTSFWRPRRVVSARRESEQPSQTGGVFYVLVGAWGVVERGLMGGLGWGGGGQLTDRGLFLGGLVPEKGRVLVRLVAGPGLVRAQGVVVFVPWADVSLVAAPVRGKG